MASGFTDYYFRIYVMNDIGRLGGSNIVSARSANRDVIKNGGFENLSASNGFPEHWQTYGNTTDHYSVDDMIARSGNYSVRTENSGGGVFTMYQQINPADLVAGGRYRLSYWIKHDELMSGDEFAVFMNDEEHSWALYINTNNGPMAESDWKLYEYEFTAVNLNTANVQLAFYFLFHSYYNGYNVRAWVDDVSLIRID